MLESVHIPSNEIHEPSATYARNKALPTLFGEELFNGTFLELDENKLVLGYTVALNKLDGVYYVDPRPEMAVNQKLREQVRDFQQFLLHDMWILSQPR